MASVDVFGISDQSILIYSWLLCGVLCQMMNLFGIITNIINIICFTKQGFAEAVNISLLALALSDLGSLVTMVWVCICFTPSFMTSDLPFDPAAVMYMTAAVPHWACTRVSSCITAMVTLERTLCITIPLKIKNIITSKRTTVVISCLFIFCFFISSPLYCVNNLGMTIDSRRNKTIVGLVSSSNREIVEMITYPINNFFIPFGAFVIIVVCTIILSIKLEKQTHWGQGTVSTAQIDRVSSRNQKVGKMVVMISTLFIVCFAPVTIMLLTVGLIPEMSLNGKYYNISFLIGMCVCLLESVNSSMNIFIYYHMSSRYRDTFRETLSGLCGIFSNDNVILRNAVA